MIYSRESFLKSFGDIYESSPWIAQIAWENLSTLPTYSPLLAYDKMREIVQSAGRDKQLALLKAHPQLGLKNLANMSKHSQTEQKKAGLTVDLDIKNKLAVLNQAYLDRHKFPFILAIKGYMVSDIVYLFEKRLENSTDVEFDAALFQVHLIALYRTQNLVE